MRAWLLDYLVCPVCRTRLGAQAARLRVCRGSDDRRIHEGVLTCASCGQVYPITGSIPRLVPPEQLSDHERAAAERLARHEGPPREEVVSPLSEEELRERLEQMVRQQYKVTTGDTAYLRRHLEHRVTYVLDYAGERVKHVETVGPYLERPIRSIVEVGGGSGGYLGSFMAETGARRGVLVDILEGSCEMALLREPKTEVIRGDAHCLPFRDGAFDLMISSMMLEHLPDWRRGALEMARVARQGYITYSPNGAFPYDHGHLDAPVHAWMPRCLAVAVAFAFSRLRRTGHTRKTIRDEVEALNLVPRRRLTRLLRRHGVSSHPLFERLMQFSVLEERPHDAARAKRLLRDHPRAASWIARALVLAGAEPVVSLYIKANRPPAHAAADAAATAPA